MRRRISLAGLLAVLAVTIAVVRWPPGAPRAAQWDAGSEAGVAAAEARLRGAVLRSAGEIPRAAVGQTEVLLATTTSTQDSGLLDVLVPMFEQQTGYRLKPIAVGTGQALALGARGEVDVVLVHAPEAERRWLADGNGTARLPVMYNDFVVVGPPDDPVGLRTERSAAAALNRIAEARALFLSRGDDSGTHQQERALWQLAGRDPRGQSWYQEAGQGMGATLTIASEKRAYTLTDRGTYLALRGTLQLAILVEGEPALRNLYHVMPVSPRRFSGVNAPGGEAFAAFLISREAQAAIARFGIEKYGQPLFFANAATAGETVPAAVR